MMGVISRTDINQGQFAFKTKKNSGSYKTHQALTKKIVSFLRRQESECLWFPNSLKRGKKFVYKRFANPGRKRESLLL